PHSTPGCPNGLTGSGSASSSTRCRTVEQTQRAVPPGATPSGRCSPGCARSWIWTLPPSG
ncbi:uncharacterized protein METZ01_LOCUS229068, partial [marine metagenome]